MNEQAIKERLESGSRILENILLRRILMGSSGLGLGIERAIVNRELRELEEDLKLNPPVLPDGRPETPRLLNQKAKLSLLKRARRKLAAEDLPREGV